MKKIVLILLLGFFNFGGNVFANVSYEINDGNSGLGKAKDDKNYQEFRNQQIKESQQSSSNYTETDSFGNKLESNSEGVVIKGTDSEGKVFYQNNIDGVSEGVNTKVDTTLTDSYTKSQLEGTSTNGEMEDYLSRQQKRSTSNSSSSSSSSNGIEVHVSEDIPGAGCVGSPGDYTCTVEPGFKTVMQLMGGIIKYFTYLAALGGVLFIVINGIMLSMGSMGGNKDEIKKKITMTIGGLILLLLSGLILNAIAPWIYK